MRLSDDEIADLLDALATEATHEPKAWMPLLRKTVQAVKQEFGINAGIEQPVSSYDVLDMMQNCGYTLPIKDDDKPAMRMFGRLMRHYGLAGEPETSYWGHEEDACRVRMNLESPLERKVQQVQPVHATGPARYVSVAIDCEEIGPKATEAYLRNAELIGSYVRSADKNNFEFISRLMCKAGMASAMAVKSRIPPDVQYEAAMGAINSREAA